MPPSHQQSPLGQWEWKAEDGSWHLYAFVDNVMLEGRYLSEDLTFTTTNMSGNKDMQNVYAFDLHSKTETSSDGITERGRQLRRVIPVLGGGDAGEVVSGGDTRPHAHRDVGVHDEAARSDDVDYTVLSREDLIKAVKELRAERDTLRRSIRTFCEVSSNLPVGQSSPRHAPSPTAAAFFDAGGARRQPSPQGSASPLGNSLERRLDYDMHSIATAPTSPLLSLESESTNFSSSHSPHRRNLNNFPPTSRPCSPTPTRGHTNMNEEHFIAAMQRKAYQQEQQQHQQQRRGLLNQNSHSQQFDSSLQRNANLQQPHRRHRERLTRIYQLYAPHKLSTVDAVLAACSPGAEEEKINVIEQKYLSGYRSGVFVAPSSPTGGSVATLLKSNSMVTNQSSAKSFT